MSVYKTIQDLQKKAARDEREKVNFFKLNGGQSVRVRFLQELAQDGANYNEERGTAKVVSVHSHPVNFKRTAVCTADDPEQDFQCHGCEGTLKDDKWRAKDRLLVNVAVQDAQSKEWSLALLEQGFGKSHVVNDLIEMAAEYGSIVDRDYKITRTGSGFNDTSYSLIPLAEGKEAKGISDLKLYNLDEVKARVPYVDQAKFYAGDLAEQTTEPQPASVQW